MSDPLQPPANDLQRSPTGAENNAPTPLVETAVGGERPTLSSPDGMPGISLYPFLSPPQLPDELGRLGGYRVLRKLGEGGMGMVFAGDDPVLHRAVALKVMRSKIADDPDYRQRFLREARLLSRIDHPNVVPIYRAEEQPVLFMAMPLLGGQSLEQRLKRTPVMPIDEVLRVARDTAEGLAAAHSAGLIHRDIKPANLWLASTASELGQVTAVASENSPMPFQVKVLDFGLARPLEGYIQLTQQHAVLGTPAYMSPEQANGLPVDARTDLFSLGCVLYEATSGRPPFAGPTLTSVLRAVAEHNPPPPHSVRPDTPPTLSALIMQLLSKEPIERPQSAQAVADIVRSLDSASMRLTPPAIQSKRPRNRTVTLGCTISVTVALTAGLVVAFLLPFSPLDAPRPGSVDGSKKVVGFHPKGNFKPIKIAGELTRDDPLDDKLQHHCKVLEVEMAKGESYVIRLKSTEFDTYVIVQDSQKKELAFNDDDSEVPNTHDSKLVWTAPNDDSYRIVVTSFEGKLGKYELTVEIAPQDKALTERAGWRNSEAMQLFDDGRFNEEAQKMAMALIKDLAAVRGIDFTATTLPKVASSAVSKDAGATPANGRRSYYPV